MKNAEQASPPAGYVAYLFTDLEGSTGLWERFPAAMESALERHDVLVRQAIDENGGFVFKTLGDAFHASFVDALDGLGAALAAQRYLVAEDWSVFAPGFPEIRVRMGLHAGRATWRDGDYYGQALNRVARLESAGNGGQVLLSLAALDLLRNRIPGGVRLRDLGEHRLKDLHHSEHITQVLADDLPDVTRALRTAGALNPRDRIVVQTGNEGRAGDEGRARPDERFGGDRRADTADRTAERSADRSVASREAASSQGLTVLERGVPETLAALRAAVCGDAPEVAFTPEQLTAAARHAPADLTDYRLGRIAEWSLPRYRLDGRFVGLTLMLDQGEDVLGGRWQATDDRYSDLGELLDAAEAPAVVVLGSPGAGKSTLLRRLELDAAIGALTGDAAAEQVTFYAPLNRYAGSRPGDAPPLPGEWLAARWAELHPDLPELGSLLAEGRMVLLLDGLNEMPVADDAEYRVQTASWRDFTREVAGRGASNQVVFGCRSLDYSAPLSSPELRVPQVRIEPLSDEQVSRFLALHAPGRWREIWDELQSSPQLEVLRTPYFLKLLVDNADSEGGVARGPAALFSGFVREAMRREVERDNPLFRPDELLSSRDRRRLQVSRRWKTPYDLPERGALLPKLSRLAYRMQAGQATGEGSQVRIDYDDAMAVLDDPLAEDILSAGMALAVLDEDAGRDEILFFHQLMQEYFAARVLARQPQAELVRVDWDASAATPTVAEAVAELEPADPLPPLPSSGWEETTVLAAAMADDPTEFVAGVAAANPDVAARCAAQPEIRERLAPEVASDLSGLLLQLVDDDATDLRYRISLAMRLGELGDPRLERREGPHGAYLLPPMVELGAHEIHGGADHKQLKAYALGRFSVTNAEWRLFVESGGYGEAAWWEGDRGQAWRAGEGTMAGQRHDWRAWRAQFRDDPTRLDALGASGQLPVDKVEMWRELIALSDEGFEAMLRERFPSRQESRPRFWGDRWYAHPALPVIGVCWFEARAYCAWLAEQSGMQFRLPTEPEWAAAAQGRTGRRYAYGDELDPAACNVGDTHLRRPAPVGVFPAGRTPEGLDDVTGNTFEWTAGRVEQATADGDETSGSLAGSSHGERLVVARGGSFADGPEHAAASFRFVVHPALRHTTVGLRLARDVR